MFIEWCNIRHQKITVISLDQAHVAKKYDYIPDVVQHALAVCPTADLTQTRGYKATGYRRLMDPTYLGMGSTDGT